MTRLATSGSSQCSISQSGARSMMSKWKILSLKYLKIYLKDQLLRKIQIKCISNQKIMSKKKEMTTLGLVFNQLFLKVSIKKKIHKA